MPLKEIVTIHDAISRIRDDVDKLTELAEEQSDHFSRTHKDELSELTNKLALLYYKVAHENKGY